MHRLTFHAHRRTETRLMLRALGLQAIAALYQDRALKAAKANLTHEAFPYELVPAEFSQRNEHRVACLQRLLGLPPGKTFARFVSRPSCRSATSSSIACAACLPR